MRQEQINRGDELLSAALETSFRYERLKARRAALKAWKTRRAAKAKKAATRHRAALRAWRTRRLYA